MIWVNIVNSLESWNSFVIWLNDYYYFFNELMRQPVFKFLYSKLLLVTAYILQHTKTNLILWDSCLHIYFLLISVLSTTKHTTFTFLLFFPGCITLEMT